MEHGFGCTRSQFGHQMGFPERAAKRLPDGMRRPVSTGCVTLPIIDLLEAQEKGDRL